MPAHNTIEANSRQPKLPVRPAIAQGDGRHAPANLQPATDSDPWPRWRRAIAMVRRPGPRNCRRRRNDFQAGGNFALFAIPRFQISRLGAWLLVRVRRPDAGRAARNRPFQRDSSDSFLRASARWPHEPPTRVRLGGLKAFQLSPAAVIGGMSTGSPWPAPAAQTRSIAFPRPPVLPGSGASNRSSPDEAQVLGQRASKHYFDMLRKLRAGPSETASHGAAASEPSVSRHTARLTSDIPGAAVDHRRVGSTGRAQFKGALRRNNLHRLATHSGCRPIDIAAGSAYVRYFLAMLENVRPAPQTSASPSLIARRFCSSLVKLGVGESGSIPHDMFAFPLLRQDDEPFHLSQADRITSATPKRSPIEGTNCPPMRSE